MAGIIGTLGTLLSSTIFLTISKRFVVSSSWTRFHFCVRPHDLPGFPLAADQVELEDNSSQISGSHSTMENPSPKLILDPLLGPADSLVCDSPLVWVFLCLLSGRELSVATAALSFVQNWSTVSLFEDCWFNNSNYFFQSNLDWFLFQNWTGSWMN